MGKSVNRMRWNQRKTIKELTEKERERISFELCKLLLNSFTIHSQFLLIHFILVAPTSSLPVAPQILPIPSPITSSYFPVPSQFFVRFFIDTFFFSALSCCDFISCGLVFFSSIAKSLKYSDQAWQVYDTMWHLPIVGISGGIGNYVIVGVAIGNL